MSMKELRAGKREMLPPNTAILSGARMLNTSVALSVVFDDCIE